MGHRFWNFSLWLPLRADREHQQQQKETLSLFSFLFFSVFLPSFFFFFKFYLIFFFTLPFVSIPSVELFFFFFSSSTCYVAAAPAAGPGRSSSLNNFYCSFCSSSQFLLFHDQNMSGVCNESLVFLFFWLLLLFSSRLTLVE